MGRPAHEPSSMSRRNVEALAGHGVPEADIVGVVGVNPKTLRKHYRQELRYGHVKANAKVAENLFRKATGDGRESVIAAIFWMKTRAQWKEASVTEWPRRLRASQSAGWDHRRSPVPWRRRHARFPGDRGQRRTG